MSFPWFVQAGSFFLLVGLGVMLGSAFPPHRRSLLGLGAAATTIALAAFAAELSRPFGSPTTGQVGALVGAIALEGVLSGVAVARYRRAGERDLQLAILRAVGTHFVPMALAFGLLCAALGVCAGAKAGVGPWIRRRTLLS